jgi:hypothetical protein
MGSVTYTGAESVPQFMLKSTDSARLPNLALFLLLGTIMPSRPTL